jgi:hypothetical protein
MVSRSALFWWTVVFAFMPASCGGVENDIWIQAASGYSGARVTPTGLSGPLTRVEFYRNSLSGDVNERSVSLVVDDAEMTVRDFFGGQPVNVQMVQQPGRIHANGLMGGALSEYDIGPDGIDGRIGRCS